MGETCARCQIDDYVYVYQGCDDDASGLDCAVFIGEEPKISFADGADVFYVPLDEPNKVVSFARAMATGLAAVEMAVGEKMTVLVAGNVEVVGALAVIYRMLKGMDIDIAMHDVKIQNDTKNILSIWACIQACIDNREKLLSATAEP